MIHGEESYLYSKAAGREERVTGKKVLDTFKIF